MSAFLCSAFHLSGLAVFAASDQYPYTYYKESRIDLNDPRKVAKILYDENLRSLAARYGEGEAIADELRSPFVFDERAFQAEFSPVEIIKACHCYQYQACETDDYYETLANNIIESIIKTACCKLVGYEQADWGLAYHPRPGMSLLSIINRKKD